MTLYFNNSFLIFSDMRQPNVVAEIARHLRKFHEVEIPGSKEPQLWNDIFKFFKKGLHLTLVNTSSTMF